LAETSKSNQNENYEMNNNQKSKFFRNVNNQPQSNSEISYKSFTNASKASMTAFKNSLIFYKTELNEIKEDLQNSSSIKAYEKSLEANIEHNLKQKKLLQNLKRFMVLTLTTMKMFYQLNLN